MAKMYKGGRSIDVIPEQFAILEGNGWSRKRPADFDELSKKADEDRAAEKAAAEKVEAKANAKKAKNDPNADVDPKDIDTGGK